VKGDKMGLEIVRGQVQVSNQLAVQSLIQHLEKMNLDGTLYLGYPVMASADSSTTVEALLVCEIPGLVAFDFGLDTMGKEEIKERQDTLAFVIEGNLSKHDSLRKGRKLGISANVITFFPTNNSFTNQIDKHYLFASPDTLSVRFNDCNNVDADMIRLLHAAIQRVTTIKPIKKRENVRELDSKGAVLKKIEAKIANLDKWQKKAAIETPNGPQRVRGLAGSGKTVVLALKAAYLQAQNREWNIAVTFNTRSLVQQFQDLIERFSYEHSGDKPNWEKLHILHAWGSYSAKGMYSTIATSLGVIPMDYGAAAVKYGRENPFEGVCNELLVYAKSKPKELYDAILVDEAQDLPASFFQLIYTAVKEPKRIIWAYDELQNLSNSMMLSVSELFDGRITVNNVENAPQQDVILPVCYRNTPWALTLAHSIGFGLKRAKGLVQLFDDLNLWREIGYHLVNGELKFDSDVTLKRREDTSPAFFKEYIKTSDAVVVEIFDDEISQYEWVAKEIKKNLTEDELDPDDILVIFAEAKTSKSKYRLIQSSLGRLGIQSHLAGVSSQVDVFQIAGSVTVSGIYRAKGNEAPMVYILNADYCTDDLELIKLRNTLFTAITRSRAWVRITGVGDKMSVPGKAGINKLDNPA
jgi:superfamily I DNA and RNA helicase